MSSLSSTSVLPPAAPASATATSTQSTLTQPQAAGVLRDIPRVLSIAGSDPSGGAGIQADLKSIAAHGGYGMAAITALTVQNTQGVRAVHVPPASFLARQLDAISDDITVDAVKIGMLGDADVMTAVRSWLVKVRPAVVVLDPVMVATSGDRLLAESAEAALQGLLPLADLITPNLAELAILLGEPQAGSWPEALEQGRRLAAATGATVLVKGGHLDGGDCPDALVNTGGVLSEEVVVVPGARIRTRNSHGTGCSLSSAMATTQARLGDWEASLRQVKPWLAAALEASAELEVGSGNGPIHHFHHVQQPQPGPADAGRTPPAPGDFADVLWAAAAPDLEAIYGLEFIQDLADGSLAEKHFAYYLAQDATYLNGYSRVLARASALAPTEAEQLFWARSAQQCLEVESELHRSWLSTRTTETVLGPVTKSYVDHLLAASASGSYAVLVAAVLPCFWLYAEVGKTLHAEFLAAGEPAAHPYAAWLRTYADEDFAAATRQAIAMADDAGRRGSEDERAAMILAFRQSCRFEVEFFDAPRLHA
ncbi:bifunctional hydroxymethylpyrimidine kinase/phosphomethylpyrimidine kinase [Arthrobacter sp. CDRTa11]|uniref:bifunctional hydroxymethylpyrimidine kinase/phosphomethylpyrimidine kinase n=1 Tax=Arthrobacter sp. CDRTa11 TaxID=2651199 RepID=UPI002265CB05|nr:bifunctional hydroxymethylpyrimidine kinase/phosphomethylpyrimidine kinase [Arthrobacter sp. CDRTa11]UZX03639.1 bifunctional hydroxymethylpyrimidine kinase/phosphomethylpyrimidine kinase [Arthrobacter sp. CDRTa11]